MSLKCFYCNSPNEKEKEKNCSGCGKELLKICKQCAVKYEQSANFCMSCGGKLTEIETEEELFVLEEVGDEDFSGESPEEAALLEIEVSENGMDDLQDNHHEKTDDNEIVILEDTENGNDEDQIGDIEVLDMKNGEIEFTETAKKFEVSTEEKKFDENQELVFKTEKKTTKIDVNSDREQSGAVFGTTNTPKKPDLTDAPSKKQSKSKKKDEKIETENSLDLDSLFDQLSTLELTVEPSMDKNASEFTGSVDDAPDNLLKSISDEDMLHIKNIKRDDVAEQEKIMLSTHAANHLTPVNVEDVYNISFDSLKETVITSEFEESCIPLLEKVGENLSKSKGGTFFLRGDAGNGTGILVNRLKSFAEENNASLGYNIAVSDANGFDFDFMIFIDLLRKLMKIKSSDVATVRKKFDKLFGESLPQNKKECLSALICLNFFPLKTKLPKHDIEYLLAYVFYGLSRGKPVVWFINNANVLNVRSIKFLDNLKKVFQSMPMAVVMIADKDAAVLKIAQDDTVFDFKGFPEDKLKLEVAKSLNAKTIPAELEKLLKEKAQGNMLFTLQLAEYLKDKGFIFEMKGSWRFSKLPDDFKCPASLDELISGRTSLLPGVVEKTLRELALLNLFEVPKILFDLVCPTGKDSVAELVKKGYLLETENCYRFASRTMLTALRKNIKIGRAERGFYRDVVTKLSSTSAEIYQLNKHWLLLSYINLGGIVDKRLNSFLFSSAVYMEKLGFFEISQRSYQTIISSFESDNPFDDFKILPEIKSARLWRFVDPQWGKLFWEKLENYAHRKNNHHLELLSKGELMVLEKDKVDFGSVADLLKKMHEAGLYEEEISLLDKATDILVESGNFIDANTFAVRGYKILRDVITRYDGKGVPPADFIYVLFVRCSCKLAEICIILGDHDKASAILEEALEYAERYDMSYFKSKVQFLLGRIKFESKEEWTDFMKDGFYNAIIGMDFAIIKAFLFFFEKNGLENEEWVRPFLEYKNWINF